MYFVFYGVSKGSMSSMLSAGVIHWYDKRVYVVSKVLHVWKLYEIPIDEMDLDEVCDAHIVYLACCMICKVE